jgi:subfamily B ATP-binding cassette protein MsbA
MAEPAATKKPRVNMARAWVEARALIWKHRKSLAVGLVLMLINRLAGLVLPASSKYLIDDVLNKHQLEKLVPLALAVGGATVVQAITSFSLSQIVSIAAQRAISDMRVDMQRHVLRLPVSFFDATKSGVLITRVMTDAEGIRNLIGTGLVQLTGGLITAIIALGVLFYLNWHLTASTIFVLLAFGGMMAVAFKRLRPLFRRRNEINAEVTGRLGEALGGIRTVKVYTAEDREERIFADGIERLFKNVAATITGTSAVGAATTVIVGVIGVLMIIIGGRSIVGGSMTLGDFVMYIFFIGLVAAPLVQIASIGTQVSEAFAGLDRIREIRQTPTEDQEDERRDPIPEVSGDVAFDHVSFEYVPGVPVLRDVSFRTAAGTTTALVGSSGAGKSTLIGLVTAFNRPTHGRVLVDGRDIAALRVRDYRAHLGVVMQDNFLFDGTIRENIAFAKPNATDEEVRAVSRIAHCDEFIERFDAKYETIVGERGVKLSGGQRQRVAIARAILADPRILILDEATSSLDSESESLIRDGLRSLRRGRTTFVIAHRLSTIESADQILVMEEGRIIERGTHRELLAVNGRYRQLYDKQYHIEHDQFINPGEDFLPVPDNAAGPIRVPGPTRGAL